MYKKMYTRLKDYPLQRRVPQFFALLCFFFVLVPRTEVDSISLLFWVRFSPKTPP